MEDAPLFTNRSLLRLLTPLLVEQVLSVTIGMADVMMVSSLGEAAISSVSLVDGISVLLIQVFAALATGGSVIAAQYLGRQDRKNACDAARQLYQTCAFTALLLSAAALSFSEPILHGVYPGLEPQVFVGAATYFRITAASYPMLAVYSAGAALFRAMGNSKVSLATSILMNLTNVAGNWISIYRWGWGVAGAAWATLFSRILGGAIFIWLITRDHNRIYIHRIWRLRFNWANVRLILRMGVPNGLENGIFQVGKLVIMQLVAGLGTAAVAANAVGSTISGLVVMPGSACSLALIGVVGQCVGARAVDQARRNTKKILGFAIVSVGLVSLPLFALLRPVIHAFSLSPEAAALALGVLTLYCAVTFFAWPLSFTLPCALRGAGDARFTMVVSIASMLLFRVALSYLLTPRMGLSGVWAAMYVDWGVRSAFFLWRFHGKRWESIKVI